MKLSAEISMYPLQENYKVLIQEFLEELNSAPQQLDIRSSNMSTRVFGDFDAVHSAINSAMKNSMQKHGKMVFACKYLEGDARELSGYE